MAAVALSALCRPGIGRAIFLISRSHLSAAVAKRDGEQRYPAGVRNIDKPHVGLRIFAVGDDAAILDAPDQAVHHRMVHAHHRKPVKRHVLDKGAEGVLHRVEALEVIEVFGIDVGHDGDVGRKLEERAVGFVGLDDHPLAGAQARIGAVGVDDAAIDHRRIETAGIEQRRHHRGGRGLAVGAGDGDAAFQAHQFRQHFGAAHHRQPLRARCDEFRIVGFDRRGDDDDFGRRRDWRPHARWRCVRPCRAVA